MCEIFNMDIRHEHPRKASKWPPKLYAPFRWLLNIHKSVDVPRGLRIVSGLLIT